MKQRLKRWLFGLIGKDPEAVVVTFASGPPELCRRMYDEIRALVPDRRHFLVTEERRPDLSRYRIGLAPVMFDGRPNALRRAAFRLAPRKILAYNTRLERHHLGLNLASLLFVRGVPLDRIYLRPWWWPWPKREKSSAPETVRRFEGRPCGDERRRVAVLSPYLPYPLSHGGAVRIYHLLREISKKFHVKLFAFTESDKVPDLGPLLDFCAGVVLVEKPRYREPQWSTVRPAEVLEYESAAMRRAIAEERKAFGFEKLQVEYTHLGGYGGDILVEHDVTFDLFGQVLARDGTISARWNWWRWRRFETAAVRRYPQVVVMSEKDAAMLGKGTVIENGVDLGRFRPEPERPGRRILFIGSFRHFPNIEAYRFFVDHVWPRLTDVELTVVAGPDHLLYWQAFAGTPEPRAEERVRLLGFVEDVRPLYVEANLVVVPTTVSAGTNLKVLEAMAMERTVVSTTSGCAGLGLVDGESVRVADTPEAFAAAVEALLADDDGRRKMARAAREHAIRNFDWAAIGEKQRALFG